MLKQTQRNIIITVISFTIISLFTIGIVMYKEYIEILKHNQNLPHFIDEIKNLGYIYVILGIIFLTISIIVSVILANTIMKPIEDLVSNAQLILKGDSVEKKPLKSSKKKDKIDDLVEMFTDMNADLKDNLSEITRKKNEIETILLHMTDGVISFDIYGKITHLNPAAQKALSIDKTATYKEVADILNVKFDMEKIIYIENLATQRKHFEKDGKIYDIVFAPLKTSEEKADGIVIVIQEITEHVKLDNMRKQFIADVSHELKTPITSILGYSETIIDTELAPDEIKYFVGKMNNEALRMSELVTDLLTLSKYDKDESNKKKSTFQVATIVKEYIENFKIEAKKKNINLQCYITSDVPEIYGDKSGIIRVITNILSNAIKYTGENGTVEVYVGFLYMDTYIKIRDNGIGISKPDLEKIFERFYRVDSSRVRLSGGSGLRTCNCKRNNG